MYVLIFAARRTASRPLHRTWLLKDLLLAAHACPRDVRDRVNGRFIMSNARWGKTGRRRGGRGRRRSNSRIHTPLLGMFKQALGRCEMLASSPSPSPSSSSLERDTHKAACKMGDGALEHVSWLYFFLLPVLISRHRSHVHARTAAPVIRLSPSAAPQILVFVSGQALVDILLHVVLMSGWNRTPGVWEHGEWDIAGHVLYVEWDGKSRLWVVR